MRRTRYLLVLLLIAGGLLAARFVWTVGRSDLGWEHVLSQWGAVAKGLLGIESTKLGDEPPPVQADYWLDVISRIDAAQRDAQIAIGAAWMLDGPQHGFLNRHIQLREVVQVPGF